MLRLKNTLDYALSKAQEIEVDKRHHQRIYAVITDKRGGVLSEASNSYRESNYIQRLYAKSVGRSESKYSHAECLALQKLGKNKGKAYSHYFRIGICLSISKRKNTSKPSTSRRKAITKKRSALPACCTATSRPIFAAAVAFSPEKTR